MINLIKRLFQNSVISYIFFGGCTTMVNMCVYYSLRWLTPWPVVLINIISITSAIIFAYFTNSRFVFHSTASGFKERMNEFIKFFSARISTMIIEIAGVEIMSLVGIDDRIGKLLTQFVVLVLNYVFSKLLVFRHKTAEEEKSE